MSADIKLCLYMTVLTICEVFSFTSVTVCQETYYFVWKILTLCRSLLPYWYSYKAAIKHPVPDRNKPSFEIFDIRAL